jgi:hypothetical protein
VPLCLSSIRSRCGRLVEAAVPERGEEDVDAASGERDEGRDVVFSLRCAGRALARPLRPPVPGPCPRSERWR